MANADNRQRRIMKYADLRVLLGGADQLRLVDGTGYDTRKRTNNTIVGETTNSALIAATIDALSFEDDGSDQRALMTWGNPTLAFLQKRELVAAISIVGRNHIRCGALWDYDLAVDSPQAVGDALAAVAHPMILP